MVGLMGKMKERKSAAAMVSNQVVMWEICWVVTWANMLDFLLVG